MDEFERDLRRLANQLFSRPTIEAKELLRNEQLRKVLEERLAALGFGLIVEHNVALVYGLPEFEDFEAEDKEWVSKTMKAIILAIFIHVKLRTLGQNGHPEGGKESKLAITIDASTIQKLLPNLTKNQIELALPRLKRLGYLEGLPNALRAGPRLLALPGAEKIKQALLNEEFFYSFESYKGKPQESTNNDPSEHSI